MKSNLKRPKSKSGEKTIIKSVYFKKEIAKRTRNVNQMEEQYKYFEDIEIPSQTLAICREAIKREKERIEWLELHAHRDD